MPRYVICPKCNLNFIDADAQEYCDVCLKMLHGRKTFTDDLEAEELAEEGEREHFGEEYLPLGETPSNRLLKPEDAYEPEGTEDEEDDEGAAWRSYLDDDVEMDIDIPDSEFETEPDEEEEEEEETLETDGDDFEYVSVDDYDFDDDEDDEEEDEDDEDDF